jgi:hypothetical protein
MKARDMGREVVGFPAERGVLGSTFDEAALQVAVNAGCCGAVEVRVSGPAAGLRLFFDPAEAQPAYIRHVVGDSVKRYRGALGLAAAHRLLLPDAARLHPSQKRGRQRQAGTDLLTGFSPRPRPETESSSFHSSRR